MTANVPVTPMVDLSTLPVVSQSTGDETLYELPLTRLDGAHSAACQIAAHLKHAMAAYCAMQSNQMILPSALELAAFYQQPLIDVMEGLSELKRHGYAYQLHGLDQSIVVQDPLGRKQAPKPPARWANRKAAWLFR
jgi:hypothetical protein